MDAPQEVSSFEKLPCGALFRDLVVSMTAVSIGLMPRSTAWIARSMAWRGPCPALSPTPCARCCASKKANRDSVSPGVHPRRQICGRGRDRSALQRRELVSDDVRRRRAQTRNCHACTARGRHRRSGETRPRVRADAGGGEVIFFTLPLWGESSAEARSAKADGVGVSRRPARRRTSSR